MNKNNKFLIIGYGAIGERHARILVEKGAEVVLVTKRTIEGFKTYKNVKEAMQIFDPDVAWICNETHLHWDTLKEVLALSERVTIIVEKPLAIHYLPEMDQLRGKLQGRVFVSYNLRFSPLLQMLKQELEGKKICDVVVNVGQDLSVWRKKDAKETYSSQKALGGGVLRDLSHEIDYLQWLFGRIEKTKAVVGRFSDVTINSEDTVFSLIETNQCSAIFMRLSYLDKMPIREIRVNTKDETIVLNFIRGSLEINQVLVIEGVKMLSTYEAQVDMLTRQDYSLFCTFLEGVDTLKVIEMISAV